MAIAGFNESYYLQTNKDVLTAYLQGKTTAEEHFLKFGANELRNPNANFDMAYYAAANPDVVAAVKAGTYANVYDHYIRNGGKEGRIPSAALANFNGAAYLAANTDLAGKYTAANVVEHYVLYGAAEGRSGGTAQQVTGNYVGTTADDTVTPAGGQASTVRVEGGQQGTKGDTLVVTSGSAASFQTMNLANDADQNQTRDNTTGNNTGNKIGPVVQGFENIDATAATINMNLTALDRTSITNTGSATAAQTGSVIQGGTGRDTLTGGNGADSLVGNDGNDQITGGAGNDTLAGGVGDDNIGGGAGNDTITDDAGNDTVTGDAGNDTITVGAGTNSIDGGADNDTITLAADQATSTTVSTIGGGDGNDTITLNATAITAASRASVSGGAGNDTITAGLGAETVNGNAGNDTVKITAANLGANDLFRGNEGQDIIQLEIPTGSGTNTFVFQSAGTTAATSQFTGFEAIALIDSSGNTNAKQYKIILTDTFVANNLVNGSFLIDARGLPGGSNLVIDFSALTAASAGLFTAGAFRVLTSPSTDVRDQNNVTITAAYSVQTGNSVLNNVTAFNVFAGDTTITAGTEAAYTTDRLVNTGTGQAAYTTTGGASDTGSGAAANTITLTSATAIVGTTFDAIGATGTNGTRTSSAAETINASTNLGTSTVIDGTAGDGDILNALLNGNTTPVLSNIETLNFTTLAANTLALASASGYNTVNFAAGNSLVAQTITGFAGGKTINIASGAFQSLSTTLTTATDAITYGLQGGTITNLTDSGTGAHTLNVTAATTLTTFQTGAAGNVAVIGSGDLTITTLTNATVINAGGTGTQAYTGKLSVTASGTASTITGGSGNDTITGGAAADSISGGAGNDTLNVSQAGADTVRGGAGNDTITLGGAADDRLVFEASASANGTDSLVGVAVANAAGNSTQFDFTAFASGRYIDSTGASQTSDAVIANLFTTADTNARAVNNAVVALNSVTALTTTQIASQFGVAKAFGVVAGQKTVVLEGDAAGATRAANIYFVEDTNNDGAIAATEVVLVGSTSTSFDLDTIFSNSIL
ncbi:beta strand repeat-containing protein [Elstera cyanobacteriorum]|uniref:beta strand repeat-containing protein n=1 Tax=Elstera cyanobacteriorum TaxID=2022747 RepID=UPI0023568405|nr:hypothetical protein [Elstera cyanobacteriorum]MCK6441482.1 hypothetical protein [Elstera cyanobacteriorum]